jgi:hypothetical protein
VHRQTGEVVRLENQQRIFDTLRRRIRKDLRYTSIKRFPDGQELESNRVMMTEGAAEEGRRGELTMRPGTERKKKQ